METNSQGAQGDEEDAAVERGAAEDSVGQYLRQE
jgi:hypothetical protein